MVRRFNIIDGRLQEMTADDPVNPSVLELYSNPDDTERQFLIDNVGIDEHTLHSALDPDELSRLEFEPDHIALIFKHPLSVLPRKSDHDNRTVPEFRVGSIGVFVFKEHLIVVQSEDVPIHDGPPRLNGLRFQTKSGQMLRLLSRSIAHFLSHLRTMNNITGEIEDHIHTSLENRYLLSLFSLEKSLVYYTSAISANQALLEKIRANAGRFDFSPEESEILEDITIENKQCEKQANNYTTIIVNMSDARASIVSNNLNGLMKTLNIITIGLMVPTMVVSIFSMNVHYPLGLGDSPYGFLVVMAFMVFALLAFLVYYRHKGW